jgi:uncharacterized RDD family membrane protein YckC
MFDSESNPILADASPEYVGFRVRFLAFIIDSIIASIVISPLVVMVMGEVDIGSYDLNDPQQALELLLSLSVNLSVDMTLMGVAVILFWIFKSSTPGKMVFSAIIINAADGGKPTSFQLIIRYLGYFISLFGLGLGFVWIAFDKRKQGWHDKMAGTIVVKSKKVKESIKSPDCEHTG